ncbi:MAG: copper resistance protein B [Desulfotignum sp.]|nr:copper resistance protein B [Desulfotignum sp.]
MSRYKYCLFAMAVAVIMQAGPGFGQEKKEMPVTSDRPGHQESVREHQGGSPPDIQTPPLPEGMSLDDVLEYAQNSPPDHFPVTLQDDRVYVFTLVEKLEYRIADDDTPDHMGWEAQGWVGKDFHKFWWKHEGEAVFDGPDNGETETDLLYSRLVTPFWNFQMGVQYANEWHTDDYDDRWSGVIGFQGLAPYKFELDNALYVSEDGDVTFACEAEYDLRITQRIVLQPLAELHVAAQDISGRDMGAGITDVNLDLRLRYEMKSEFAPYIGIRYRFLVGETADIAEEAGADTTRLYFMAGVRFAF